MSNHSFISSLFSLALPSVHYKMSNMLADMLLILNELFGAPYNIFPRSKEYNKLLAVEMNKISFGSQNHMGACSQAPSAAPGQRQMGTFYTWPYFSYWEVM